MRLRNINKIQEKSKKWMLVRESLNFLRRIDFKFVNRSVLAASSTDDCPVLAAGDRSSICSPWGDRELQPAVDREPGHRRRDREKVERNIP